MTTVDHLVALCGSLRHSWGWLADHVEPSNARRNHRTLTEHAKAKRNERLVQERSDRPNLTASARIVGGGQPPANLGAIEARLVITDQVDQLAAELSLAVATVHRVGAHYTNTGSTDGKFLAGLNWISRCAGYLRNTHLIDDAYQRLSRADTLARSIAGEGPTRQRLPDECPCCGRRALALDTSSVDVSEHHIQCTHPTCVCQGVECACGLADRLAGMRHTWLRSTWNRLARQPEEP